MKKGKRYFVGWIIGKQFNKDTAVIYAKKLGYGNNLIATKKCEDYFAIYIKIKPEEAQ